MSETAPSPILRYFTYDHLLSGEMRRISAILCQAATQLDDALPDGAEKATALRKLLEAKDAAVRASLDIPAPPVLPPSACPHAVPFVYCDGCKATPCPIGLDQ